MSEITRFIGGLFGKGQDEKIEHFLGAENTTPTPQLTSQELEIAQKMHLDPTDSDSLKTIKAVMRAQGLGVVVTQNEAQQRKIASGNPRIAMETTPRVRSKKPNTDAFIED